MNSVGRMLWIAAVTFPGSSVACTKTLISMKAIGIFGDKPHHKSQLRRIYFLDFLVVFLFLRRTLRISMFSSWAVLLRGSVGIPRFLAFLRFIFAFFSSSGLKPFPRRRLPCFLDTFGRVVVMSIFLQSLISSHSALVCFLPSSSQLCMRKSNACCMKLFGPRNKHCQICCINRFIRMKAILDKWIIYADQKMETILELACARVTVLFSFFSLDVLRI